MKPDPGSLPEPTTPSPVFRCPTDSFPGGAPATKQLNSLQRTYYLFALRELRTQIVPNRKTFHPFTEGICLNIFTARKVWGKVTFSQACVIPSVHGEGGGLHPEGVSGSRGSESRRVCLQGVGGLGRPPSHWILQDMVNERAVRILLECILVII